MIVDGRRFLVVGHRGAAARAPENTAVSLALGLASGADQIEIDVGLTRDGRPVLLHDTTLDRTTEGRGPLRARSWAEVRALDAGSWFGGRFAGEPPIDLDDALAIVRPRQVLIVEIKAAAKERARGVDPIDRATVDAVLLAFERTGGLRGVTVSSAAWTLLAYAVRRAPGLDVALTVRSAESRDPIAWARRIGATALHPNQRLATPSFIARARAMGLSVIPYTVNRAAELHTLLDAGADGVFTDDPAALRRVLARRSPEPAPRGTLTLGIDQGSGGTRAVVVDADGRTIAVNAAPVASRRDRDGAIVQDGDAIAASVVRAALPLAREASRRIAAAGLAVQRSSLIVWRNSDVRPVTPVLSWRSGLAGGIPSRIAEHEHAIRGATGLTTRFPYGALRLRALCAESPEIAGGLREGRLTAGPLGAFLVARLAEGARATCDPSLAQRTLAFDLAMRGYSEELAGLLGVDRSYWPEVSPSVGARGQLKLGRIHIPLRALAGDVGAATRAVVDPGEENRGVLILGTGGFVVVPTLRRIEPVEGLLTSVLYEGAEGPSYAIEGTVHGLSAALMTPARDAGWDGLPPERVAARSGAAPRAPRVCAAPEGTGTPDWDDRSVFTVEPGDFAPEEIVRGALDDLAGRFGRIADLLRAHGNLPPRFVATGGLAFAPHLTTRIGSRMGVPITIDPIPNRTAVGAALLARDARTHAR